MAKRPSLRFGLTGSPELMAALERIAAATGAPIAAEPLRVLEEARPMFERLASEYERVAALRHQLTAGALGRRGQSDEDDGELDKQAHADAPDATAE